MYDPAFAETQEIVFVANNWVRVAFEDILSCWKMSNYELLHK